MPHDHSSDGSPPDQRPPVIRVLQVLGHQTDARFADDLHRLAHRDRVDVLWLPRADMARRRMKLRSAAGHDVAIALPRTQTLFDGAVLLLTDQAALIARAEAQEWLRLAPASAEAALMLGYHAGNLHWRVRFGDGALLVALEAPVDSYLDRLRPLDAKFSFTVEGSDG